MANTMTNTEFQAELKKFFAQEDQLTADLNDGLITREEFEEKSFTLTLKFQAFTQA